LIPRIRDRKEHGSVPSHEYIFLNISLCSWLLHRRTIHVAGPVIRIRTIIRPGTLVFGVVYGLPVPLDISGNIWPGRHVIAAAIKKRKQHSEFVPSIAATVPVAPEA
jgi:hypothetical protein